MSKAIIDSLLLDLYGTSESKVVNKVSRIATDTLSGHLIEFSLQDLKNLLVQNYFSIKRSKSITKERQKLLEKEKLLETNKKVTRADAAFSLISSSANDPVVQKINNLSNRILADIYKKYSTNIPKDSIYHPDFSNDTITFYLDRNNSNKIKEIIFDIVFDKNLENNPFLNFTQSEKDIFSRITQFHHKGERTVGYSILKNLNSLKANSVAKQLAMGLIKKYLEQLDVSWSGREFYIGSSNITKKVQVYGTIGSNLQNAPGQEPADWKNIKEKLVQELAQDMAKSSIAEELATGPGSQPFIKKLGARIINKAVVKIKKDKKVRIKTLLEEGLVKYPSKNSIKKASNKQIKKPRGVGMKVQRPTMKEQKQVTQPTLNLNALKAQINARLSMTVIKNMGTPALENRTGRFARSAIVTDVTQTSKGFPSIGYTYQKYPYQTFEPGFKQGSVQRDPRTLIDRSIREIASELLVGRFYTRRT